MTAPRTAAGPRRSLPALAAALVRGWWPQVAALAAAAAVVAATITGGLGVGAALTRGLRDLALERLGGIEAAVMTDELFRADLARRLAGTIADDPRAAGVRLVPAIVIEASVETVAAGAGRAVTRATLLACDDVAALGFPTAPPTGAGGLVNGPLVAALGVGPGAEVVVRLPPRSAVPADSPLGRRGGLAESRRLAIDGVLPDAGLGRFALEPAAATRPLVVVPLSFAQQLLGRDGGVNLVLAARATGAAGDATAALRSALGAALTLDDLGLVLEPVAAGAALRLSSRRLILPPEADRAAAAVLGPRGGRPTLAFLATAMRPEAAGEPGAEIPYSTVLGIEATELPVGELVDDDGRPLAVPAADQIVIDRWMADDLAAQGRPVAVGDRLVVRFFRAEAVHGRVEEDALTLAIAGIAAMRGAAIERTLVPEVEGVTDANSIADWDPPFPFDRTRIRATPPHDEDDRYWQAHGAAPKAFVSLATARRIAGSRFGATTAWLAPAADAADLSRELVASVEPAGLGLRVVPLRAEALEASRGSTPFGGLFLALSSFVVAAGLLLEWLLFSLLVAARSRDVGVLAAVGWPPARIARLLAIVGGMAALGGVAFGTALGPVWARGLLGALGWAWEGGVERNATAVFARWPAVVDLLPGAVAAAAASLAALVWAARRAARLPPATLLAGRDADAAASRRGGGGMAVALAAVLLAVAVGCGMAGRRGDAASAVGLFFAAGFAALGGFLSLVRAWLACRDGAAVRTLAGLARRGLGHRRGRAFAVAATVAVAEFLVVAVSAFRLAPPSRLGERDSPTGGWTHLVSFAAATSIDPTDDETRPQLGLTTVDERILAACDVSLLRSSGGADAACTSLYDAAGRTTILGVGPRFIARGGFRFTATARPAADPWSLLERPADATGPVPAILDAATAQWALKAGGVGSRLRLPDAAGRPVELEIVGLLDLSILQGFVLVAEREFARMFPARSGYGLALVDAGRALDAGRPAEAVSRALASAWADAAAEVTPAAERLARLQAVQNTFLSAFQSLGTLGLLLGTAGVAAVQAQGVAERRGQLALVRAIGFTPGRLRRLLVLETLWTVGLGLAAGAAAGAVAVLPLVIGRGGGLPLGWLAATGGLVLVGAVAAALLAASRHAIPERPAAE